MKKIILAAMGCLLVLGFQAAALASRNSHFDKIAQKCDDVDPGDEDHFE